MGVAEGFKPVRVLIIEDSDDILVLLKTELELLGYTVEAARDGIQGLAAAQRFRPDVVVSDIGLPGIDGFEFVQRARHTPGLTKVPVVALTGYDLQNDRALARQFDACVIKPVDCGTLSRLIQDLLARS